MKTASTRQKVLIVISGLVVLLMLLAMSGFMTTDYIKKLGVRQLKLVTAQTAEEADAFFVSSQEQIQSLAQLYGYVVEKNGFSVKRLNEVAEKSSFDYFEFISPDGKSVDLDNNFWNDSGQEYYKQGIKGRTGYCVCNYDVGNVGIHMMFYAPIRYKNGSIYGVLCAYYDESVLEDLIKIDIGTKGNSFICSPDGTVISGTIDGIEGKNLTQYFLGKKYIDKEEVRQVDSAFNENSKQSVFSFNDGKMASRAVVQQIGDTGFLLIKTISGETFSSLIKSYEKMSREAIFIVLAIYMVLLFAIVFYNKRKREVLEGENEYIMNVLTETQKIFRISMLVDLKKDTYEFEERSDNILGDLPSRGSYSGSLNHVSGFYVDSNRNNIASNYLAPDNLRKLLHGKNKISFSLDSFTGSKYFISHVIGLEKDGDNYSRALLFCFDVSEIKEKQLVERKLNETIFNTTFVFTSLINFEDKTINVLDSQYAGIPETGGEFVAYDRKLMELPSMQVILSDREKYLKNLNFEKILNELENYGKYDFYITFYTGKGITETELFHYRYYDYEKKIVLCAIEHASVDLEYDGLTGLYSNAGFVKRIIELLDVSPDDQYYAMLHFDVRSFKGYNEFNGYGQGDELLKHIAQNLQSSSLNPIFTARTFADHFNCILKKEDLDYEEIVKLCKCVDEGGNKTANLTCGIYFFNNSEKLVYSICDKARLAENNVRNSETTAPYFVYDESMDRKYYTRYLIQENFDAALAAGRLKVYCQPIYDADTQSIVSAEALVRWEQEDGSLLRPDLFISVLEESGQIIDLDRYMTREVLNLQERRSAAGLKTVPISVNFSRYDLCNYQYMDEIKQELAFHHRVLDKFRIEITESGVDQVAEYNKTDIEEIQSMGVGILIDDFGKGYSSLANLMNYNYDIIKLDRSFVDSIGLNEKVNNTIIAVIGFAHSLEKEVIAEGVETEQQLEFLHSYGCEYVQGYLLSKPLPLENFEKLLNNEK